MPEGESGVPSDPSRRHRGAGRIRGAGLRRLRRRGLAKEGRATRAARGPPWKLPDRTDLADTGLPAVRRDGRHGCLGEPRAHQRRTELASCALPGRSPATGPAGTAEPTQTRKVALRRSRSPEAPAAARPRPPIGARTTITPPSFSTYPRPSTASCPQSPLTASAQLRDG